MPQFSTSSQTKFYLLADFSSMNVSSGAFQTGPCKKQISESNTHALLSSGADADILFSVRFHSQNHNWVQTSGSFICWWPNAKVRVTQSDPSVFGCFHLYGNAPPNTNAFRSKHHWHDVIVRLELNYFCISIAFVFYPPQFQYSVCSSS